MDLGLTGKTALLCASNVGLGLACAKEVAAEGANVVINGRNQDKTQAAAAELAVVAKGDVFSVLADVTTDEGRAKLLAACPDPDILLTNNAGPKSKRFFETERADWESTLQANYIPSSNMHLDGGSYPGLV